MIQTFLHRRYSFVFSVLKILYDLNVYYDFFLYSILTQLRLEEVTVGERFSGFSQPLSQIVDPDTQDQTLRHFSYQIFIRWIQCALFLQNIVPFWPKSATVILCVESIWKCCYSNLVRISLVRIPVCEVLNTAIFSEIILCLFLFRWYTIGLNPSSESRTIDFHVEQPFILYEKLQFTWHIPGYMANNCSIF